MAGVFLLFVTSLLVTVTYGTYYQTPTIDLRIIGGDPCNITDFPYQVSVMYIDHHVCGGVLIEPNFIITAAHCMEGFEPHHLLVRAGSSNLEQGGKVVPVKNIYRHEEFDNISYKNDIALLKLAEKYEIGPDIQVINLPNQNDPVLESQIGVATGWGRIKEDGAVPMELQKVELPVIDFIKCLSLYDGAITDTMFCAGYLEGGKDTCVGDSGGPLVVNSVLTGITSWGIGCARPNLPGVYTQVSVFRNYIDNIINSGS